MIDTAKRPPAGPSGFGRLAALAVRRPWRIVAVTLVAAGVAAVFGGPVASMLPAGGFEDPQSQSVQARDALTAATGASPDGTIVALIRTDGGVASAAGAAEIAHVTAVMQGDPGIARVVTPAQGGAALVSRDRQLAYVIGYADTVSVDEGGSIALRVRDALASDPHVTVGGFLIANKQITDQVSKDLARAEMLAFPILFLLLLVAFRGVVAALLPPLVGGLTIVGTLLVLRVVDSYLPMSIFALNLSTGLGLGLAIDYSLLMLSRYREEVAVSGYGVEAIRRTLATSGRTVLFSSLTVTAALASLLVFPQRFLYSMGVAGVSVTVLSALVALVVLPAVLALLGRRIEALPLRRRREQAATGTEQGWWYRLSRLVMRRPALVAASTAALLLALGSPFLGIRFTSVDASVLPESASARQVDDVLRTRFPDNGQAMYALVREPSTPSGEAAVASLVQRIQAMPGVAGVQSHAVRGGWEVDVFSNLPPLSDGAKHMVESLRALPASQPLLVGGQSAYFLDLQTSLGSHLPLAIAIVALATVLVLFAMTGSVVLPIKAVLMNALSLSAAFGALVLIFQDGRFTNLLQYTSQGALESTQPILLFAIAFGLSTDYGVFLLQRIKEGHDAGLSTTEAVAQGLERTGRIVTAAALLFCIAIGAFATSSIVFIKEVGVGTALAVLIDATVVRALLVPSLMALLGRWNWWAPRPLRALHHRLGFDRLEGTPSAPATVLPA
jgi:RND superfamily putative drug exporter